MIVCCNIALDNYDKLTTMLLKILIFYNCILEGENNANCARKDKIAI